MSNLRSANGPCRWIGPVASPWSPAEGTKRPASRERDRIRDDVGVDARRAPGVQHGRSGDLRRLVAVVVSDLEVHRELRRGRAVQRRRSCHDAGDRQVRTPRPEKRDLQRKHLDAQRARAQHAAVENADLPSEDEATAARAPVVECQVAFHDQRTPDAAHRRASSEHARARDLDARDEIGKHLRVDSREAQIGVVDRDGVVERDAERTLGVRLPQRDVGVRDRVVLREPAPLEREVHLAARVRRERQVRPAHVVEDQLVAAQRERHVARAEHEAAAAGSGGAPGEGRGRARPPDRVGVERERAVQVAESPTRRTDEVRVHRQSRDFRHARRLSRLRDAKQREAPVDRIDLDAPAQAAGPALDEHPRPSAHRLANGAVGRGALQIRRRRPGRDDQKTSVHDLHVRRADPVAPSYRLRWRVGRPLRRVDQARKNARPVPYALRVFVEDDVRPHEHGVVELNAFAKQVGDRVVRHDRVDGDERRARAVGDHDVLERHVAQHSGRTRERSSSCRARPSPFRSPRRS